MVTVTVFIACVQCTELLVKTTLSNINAVTITMQNTILQSRIYKFVEIYVAEIQTQNKNMRSLNYAHLNDS